MILYKVIGLMSGTSLDGLDLAYCHFRLEGNQWSYKILATRSVSYDLSWQKSLKEAIFNSTDHIDRLDITYGQWLGAATRKFIEEEDLDVDLIASHGHTIFHEPEKGITLQIGSGAEIAKLTGKKVVCDFRKEDVALGGQGAPLVPIGDELLFSNYALCLNLGGIANISYKVNDERIAFDVGMANMPLNYLSEQIGQSFDKDGELAQSGAVNQELLEMLNSASFFQQPPPKSLGVEWFNQQIKPLLDITKLSIEDKLATVVEHEAMQVGRATSGFGKRKGEILITGGGAFNAYLIDRLNHFLPANLTAVLPSPELISFKEALVFAFMGVLKIENQINCLKSVTGARRNSSSGVLFLPD